MASSVNTFCNFLLHSSSLLFARFNLFCTTSDSVREDKDEMDGTYTLESQLPLEPLLAVLERRSRGSLDQRRLLRLELFEFGAQQTLRCSESSVFDTEVGDEGGVRVEEK